ncbi:Oxygen-dependent choline dehydrogenase [Grifola frondosa]|uniref:Oxygen-dependent choline dehydrogenase n=1 Tax=Grifola frondosa TaxID=5627 RepID=A0A1C7MD94_GRIFR|nr:Oxygen-dependent choline dehydrogenase [Grifola frondosa]
MKSMLFTYLLFFFVIHSRAASSPVCESLPIHPSDADISSFLEESFDYVIIGGGTAGMALAARLAEDASLTVGVIEAGYFHKDDPDVDVPHSYGACFGNSSYDWNFVTVPQVHAAGRNISLPRGKMIGGSSGINGLAWNRASAVEYDAWSEFAPQSHWTWSGILPFLKEAETFALSPSNPYPGITQEQRQETLRDLPSVDGFSGPIVGSLNAQYFEIVPTVVQTLNFMGFYTNPEPTSGDATRSTGYYCDQPSRSNLHILTGAQATKIYFANAGSELVATGVQFAVGSQYFVANATKEVILSAGTVQTPQLLELSGIGNSTILTAYGITTLIDLPGVGENLQEHLYAGVQLQLKPGYETFDILQNNATYAAEQMSL